MSRLTLSTQLFANRKEHGSQTRASRSRTHYSTAYKPHTYRASTYTESATNTKHLSGGARSAPEPVEHQYEVARDEGERAGDDVRRHARLLALRVTQPLGDVRHLGVPALSAEALGRDRLLGGSLSRVELAIVRRAPHRVRQRLEGLRYLLELSLRLVAPIALVAVRVPLARLPRGWEQNGLLELR